MSEKTKKNKPDWVPDNASEGFSTNIIEGIDNQVMNKNNEIKKSKDKTSKKEITINDYINGVKLDDRSVLAQAITLVESNSSSHIHKAQEVLKNILPDSGKSIRIGITGPPGAGKSTFIESLGCYLCEMGKKVAVLAIDPSSSQTHGSILGDKTRMEKLSRYPNSYIRPSPSAGTLGGVARKTRETILLCEAAGFDVILIETIGVGQSEITARSMVDYFLVMIMPGSGDELQGIKKGVIELADCVVVNKADGDSLNQARLTQDAYRQALHYLTSVTEGWMPKVLTCSSLNDSGIEEIWNDINEFISFTEKSGTFQSRRREQLISWVYNMIEDELKDRFFADDKISKLLPEVEKNILDGNETPVHAVQKLMESYFGK